MNHHHEGTKARRSRLWLGLGLLAVCILSACRKPYPAEPYDVRRPPFDADVVIRAVDITETVPYLDLELVDPDGKEYTGMTDNTGVLTFDFPDMTRGLWRAFLPAQGRYHDSEMVFEAKGGVNDVTFLSDPKLILSPATQVTYSFTTQTQVVLDLLYDQGGDLRVPVTIVGSSLPDGWDMGHTPLLGRETNEGAVTIAIPPGEYRQPVVDMYGYAKGSTEIYVNTITNPTSSVTIQRGFPVTLFLEFSWTSIPIAGGSCILNGYYSFYQANGDNIPWSGNVMVGRFNDIVAFFNTTVSFTGATTGTWACNLNSGNAGYELYFGVNIHSPDFGSYYRVHGCGIAGNVAGSHVIRVPEEVY